MVACTLVLAAIIPTAALAGAKNAAHGGHHEQHCVH
jgi:hypothetical protein